jgi:hypothetical protein
MPIHRGGKFCSFAWSGKTRNSVRISKSMCNVFALTLQKANFIQGGDLSDDGARDGPWGRPEGQKPRGGPAERSQWAFHATGRGVTQV